MHLFPCRLIVPRSPPKLVLHERLLRASHLTLSSVIMVTWANPACSLSHEMNPQFWLTVSVGFTAPGDVLVLPMPR